MEPAFRNTEQNADVTRMTEFAGIIDFSDRTARMISVDNTVWVLLGSGREGQLDRKNSPALLFKCRAFARLRRLFLLLMLLLAELWLCQISLERGNFWKCLVACLTLSDYTPKDNQQRKQRSSKLNKMLPRYKNTCKPPLPKWRSEKISIRDRHPMTMKVSFLTRHNNRLNYWRKDCADWLTTSNV